jgi:hypothetical protein
MVKILKNIKIFVFCLVVNNCFCQDFTKNISGTIGLLNPKIRIQYEAPIGIKQSYGLNLNYYLVAWTGPILELFYRRYDIRKSNDKGWFKQVKIGYGNLESLPYMNSSGKRWSTFGGGFAWGYKHLTSNGFTIETLAGVRFYTPPNENEKNGNQQVTNEELENFTWILTTGFPLDLQIKFGYQF